MARNHVNRGLAALLALGFWGAALPSRAAEAPVARARLAGELVDEIVHGLLPVTVTVPRRTGERELRSLRLLGVRYCGPGEKGSGRFRARASTGSGEATLAPSCAGSLTELVERAGPGLSEGTVFVDLEASWKGWELHLDAVGAVVAGKDGAALPAPGFEERTSLLVGSTAELRIETGAEPIVFHAALAFEDKGIGLALSFAERAPQRAPRISAGRFVMPDSATCTAELPLVVANQLLGSLTARRPLAVPLQGETLDIAGVSLAASGAGREARLILTGSAEARTLREPARWSLTAGGEPLRLTSVTMTGRSEPCEGLGTVAAVACRVRNGARVATAEASGRGLTERYQQRLVHELVSPVSLSVSIAGQRVVLHGDLTRLSATAAGLTASARLSAR